MARPSLFYEVCRWSAHCVVSLLYDYRRFGMERLPREGPCLIVANHASWLDPPFVGLAAPRRQLSYLAREGLFTNPAFGWLIRALHSVAVKEDGAADIRGVRSVLQRLDEGGAVLIFSEGSRSADGAVGPFQRGIGVLVKRSRCPVLPVGIRGAHEAWPRGQKLPGQFRRRIEVRIGRAISHDDLMAHGADAALERLRQEVARLAGASDAEGGRAAVAEHPAV